MSRVMRKTQRKIETLIAWLLALVFIGLVGAGAWYVWTEVIVV